MQLQNDILLLKTHMEESKGNKLIYFISALLILVLMKPYFVWDIDVSIFRYALLLIMIFFFDTKGKGRTQLFMMFLAIMLLIPITHGYSLTSCLGYFTLAFIPFTNERYFKGVYRSFLLVYTGVVTISVVIWVFALLGVISPIGVIPPLISEKNYNYTVYPFLVMAQHIQDSVFDLIRFSGVFDEPGVIGTINLILLYINDADFKKPVNILLMVTGVCSLSLAFFVGIFVLLIFQVFKKEHSKKYKFAIIIFTASLAISCFTIPFMQEFIGDRLEYNQDTGKLAGDDRSNAALDYYIDSIRWSKEYWLGATKDIVESPDFEGKWGIQVAILMYGMLFIALYVFFYWRYSKLYICQDKYHTILFLLMLVMVLYQRPFVIYCEYIFLFAAYPRIVTSASQNIISVDSNSN